MKIKERVEKYMSVTYKEMYRYFEEKGYTKQKDLSKIHKYEDEDMHYFGQRMTYCLGAEMYEKDDDKEITEGYICDFKSSKNEAFYFEYITPDTSDSSYYEYITFGIIKKQIIGNKEISRVFPSFIDAQRTLSEEEVFKFLENLENKDLTKDKKWSLCLYEFREKWFKRNSYYEDHLANLNLAKIYEDKFTIDEKEIFLFLEENTRDMDQHEKRDILKEKFGKQL